MSASSTQLVHLFGLKGSVRRNIEYVDENVAVYPCGNLIVVYNLESKTQRFINPSDTGEAITALAVSPNKRTLAIAERERGERGSVIVSLFDTNTLKKKKVLTWSTLNGQNVFGTGAAGGSGTGTGTGAGGGPSISGTNGAQIVGSPGGNAGGPASAMVGSTGGAGLGSRMGGTSSSGSSFEVVDLSFSADNSMLLAQGSAPEWTLAIWQWEKTKVLATIRASNAQGTAVYQTSLSPVDGSVCCATGNTVLKLFRLQEGVLKPVSIPTLKREPANYLSHCWLPDDRLVVSTDTGELLLFDNLEYRTSIAYENSGDFASINTIHAFPKGFICGGGNGTMRVFEGSDESRDMFQQTKVFHVHGESNQAACITAISISPSEDNLVCTLSNLQTYTLNLTNTDILKSEDMSFDLLSTSVHAPGQGNGSAGRNGGSSASPGSAQITGMDACMRKPLLVTCGLDCSVRVWNYMSRTVELEKVFPEEAYSAAFHPSGLFVLIGFADKLKLMNLLMDDIRAFKDIPIKACRECRFSTGGQYFAAVNGNAIQVFRTYTFDCVVTLRAHVGKVRSLQWSTDDRTLISTGMDGAVYRWCLKDGTKEAEYLSKGSKFACLTSNGDASIVHVVAGGADDSFKEIELPSCRVTRDLHLGAHIGSIVMSRSGRAFYGGASIHGHQGQVYGLKLQAFAGGALRPGGGVVNGSIAGDTAAGGGGMLAMPASNTGSGGDSVVASDANAGALASAGGDRVGSMLGGRISAMVGGVDLVEMRCHSGPVTRMCITPDDLFLFTASEDGSLAMFNIRDPVVAKKREKEASLPFAEEVLVTKSDLEEKTETMRDLKNKVDELTLHNEYQLRLKDMNYNEKIKEVTNKFTEEIEAEREKYKQLEQERIRVEEANEEQVGKLEVKLRAEQEDFEGNYQAKIAAEVERYQQLVRERDELNQKCEEENALLVESHERYLDEQTAEYEKKIAAEAEGRERINLERFELMRTFEQQRQDLEEDADLEVKELKSKYDAKLSAEREATLRLKGENGIMKKKYSSLQQDIEAQKDNIKTLVEKEMELYEKIKGLEKDIQGHKKEIKEREETIQDKEKRIYDLKKKNQELEKFKFVLDYKIKELKRQIEPRESEIADMRQQIREMDLELDQYHKSNAALDLMIGELKLKIEGMQREIDDQRTKLLDGEVASARYRSELHGCMEQLQDHKSFKVNLVALFKQYIQNASTSGGKGAGKNAPNNGTSNDEGAKERANVQKEYNRQREYLEKSVESLKRKLTKDMKTHSADNMRLMRESVDLTNEINRLRREIMAMQSSATSKRPGGHGSIGMATVSLNSSIGAPNDSFLSGSSSGGGAIVTAKNRAQLSPPTHTGGERQMVSPGLTAGRREAALQKQQLDALQEKALRLEELLGL